MKIFACVILLFVSAVSWVSCVQTLEGSVGGAVDITCKYPDYIDVQSVVLKKMDFSKNVTIIESTQKDQTVTSGRFSLYHDSANRFFTVTIHNLSREDAGIYSCRILRYEDDYNRFSTEIELEVKHAPPTSKPPLTTGSTSAHSTPAGHLMFVFVRLVAAGLCFGLLHLTFFFMRSRVKGKEAGSPSTYTNTRNIEEESSV